jgi:2'-5' RNA ligase
LAASGGDIKSVSPQSLHIVLSRFNEVPIRRIGELIGVLNDLYFEVFAIKLESCLIQPNLENPKTIWIQVSEGFKQLRRLAVKINGLVVQVGLNPVKGSFNPYVKVAEIRSIREESSLKAAVCRLLKVRVGSMNVRTIKLKQENFSTSLITYEKIHEVKLMRK